MPTKNLPSIVVANVLEAMRFHSAKGRDRFPRLLELISLSPEIQPLFIEEVKITREILKIVGEKSALLDVHSMAGTNDGLTRYRI